MNNNWFEIDNLGWKRMNVGRPPEELVKELIQNILDETFEVANINYYYKNDKFFIEVEDDIKSGIKDSSLITTVFMTGKEDSYLKRGRKGRGLKEFLSVCESAIVETVGNTVEFCVDGTRKEYKNNRDCGTKISCVIKEDGWTIKAVNKITNFIKKIIINKGTIYINGKKLQQKNILYNITKCYLETQIIVDGKQIESDRYTDINIYAINGKKGWLYEMGIPVVETDIPYDIDIQQRIPLNDNRNEVGVKYINNLKLRLVQGLLPYLSKNDLIGWATEAINCSYEFTYEQEKSIIKKVIGDFENFEKIAIKSNRKTDDSAKQRGYTIIDTDSMHVGLRHMALDVFKSSDSLIQEIESKCEPIIVEPNENENDFIKKHKNLVEKAIGLKIEINIVEKPEDLISNKKTLAFYNKGDPSVLSYNRLAISKAIFSNPYGIKALEILFHELGHEISHYHEFDFIDAVTNYAAKITTYLMKNKVEKKEKTVKSTTLKEKIKKILEVHGFQYMSLKEIYTAMNVNVGSNKAGIRSILNRNCLSEDSIFERCCVGGMYRLRVENSI